MILTYLIFNIPVPDFEIVKLPHLVSYTMVFIDFFKELISFQLLSP